MNGPFGLIGHHQVVETARSFAGHALLLHGPARVGKRPTARVLAALMNCERGVAAGPCGVCRSCQGVLHGAHPDLLEIEPKTTTASGKTARRQLIGVSAITEKRDDSREYEQHVIEWLETAPTYARKVVIVDGAEYLNDEGANALLKVVEQPPHRALFLFLAQDVQAVLPTIASRAARLGLGAVEDEVLARVLLTLGEEDPELLAFAAGRPGVIIERTKAREALHDARVLFEALPLGMLGALEAAEGLEKRFDPRWHPEALQFVLRGADLPARRRADLALQRTLAALEQYVSPSLAFQLLALELRDALGLS